MEFSYIGNQDKKDVRLAGSFANGAFVTANSGASFANGAFVTANSGASFANAAFVTANASYLSQNTTAIFSNAAFDRANAAYTQANTSSTDTWVRGQANNAYDTANSSGSFANGAFVTSNSAASFANAAFARANAAYAQANTSGSGTATPVSIYSDAFTANGATSTFNLSTTPTSENYIIVVVDGITQLRSTYTVTGNVVAFDSTFENGANVEITTITGGGAVDTYASNTANAAYATANAAFLQANTGSTDTWVRTQANNAYDKANSAGSFANGSFIVANSAASFANASFDRANAAYAQANNSTDTWVRGQANNAYDKANSAGSFANGAFITANASFAWGNHASAGYATTTYVGNAIANLVNSAPTTLDTLNELATALGNDANFSTTIATSIGVTNSFANGAFLRANASYASQNTTASFANGAFDKANSAASFANGAFVTANAAFNAANNATDPWVRNQANNAYNTANAAFTAANTAGGADSFARAQANAAFNKANTSSTATLTGYVDAFTGDGSNSAFTLSTTPDSENIIFVSVQGVMQPKTSYSLSGNILTFDSVPPNTAYIEVTTLSGTNIGSSSLIYRTYTGNNTATNFIVTSGVVANNLLVAENGILQRPITDYTVSGANVVFSTAPAAGVDIQVRELAVTVSSAETLSPFLLMGG